MLPWNVAVEIQWTSVLSRKPRRSLIADHMPALKPKKVWVTAVNCQVKQGLESESKCSCKALKAKENKVFAGGESAGIVFSPHMASVGCDVGK